ncbi:MAG: hypothetical protein ACQKBT_02775, partial [Puniceicoccales bacterium]
GYARSIARRINPPERKVARALLQACRQNNPRAAEESWLLWRSYHPNSSITLKLERAVSALHRQRFGPSPQNQTWQGKELAESFRENLRKQPSTHRNSSLPPLNQ